MKTIRFTFIVAIALLASCSAATSEPAAIPLLGDDADIAKFMGRWKGTLNDGAHEEPIEFTIAAPSHGPAGSVVLTTTGGGAATLLYLRVSGDSFAGAGNPRFEEQCKCSVYRTVRGELAGDVMRGEIQRVENRRQVVVSTFTVWRTH